MPSGFDEEGELPALFRAVTLNVYVIPGVSPATLQVVGIEPEIGSTKTEHDLDESSFAVAV
jgi:hypothetical protein